ncbi:membrane protein [Rhodopirellula maiorica SM1]|uniref:Membrane protein n=1 Tax=Rhodopirellula maiorica SM1 TaxID=1265738 RepID=M5RAD1_9BACT|nr:membrane protein [Rhodopirellula maiorica SM1]
MQYSKLNGLSIAFAFTIFTAIVYLNLDGYQLHLAACVGTPPSWYGPGNFSGEPPWDNWTHGWPIGFATRLCYDPAIGMEATTSRWPWDGTPLKFFHPTGAVLNCVIAVLLIFGAYGGSKPLFNRLGLDLRFSVSSLLSFTLASAVVFSARSWLFATRYTIQLAALLVIAVGAAFCGLYVWETVRESIQRRRHQLNTT